MKKQNFRTDVHTNKFTDKNGEDPTCWNVDGKSWRLEQGIIYDCYAKYVLEEVSDKHPVTEVF